MIKDNLKTIFILELFRVISNSYFQSWQLLLKTSSKGKYKTLGILLLNKTSIWKELREGVLIKAEIVF